MGEEKNMEDIVLKTEDGKIFEVPVEGSIGLLALGAVGLKAWRSAKQNAKIDNQPPESLQENDEMMEEE